MGIYNRDYFRNEQKPWRTEWMASGYKLLIAANIVVFVFQTLLAEVTSWLALAPAWVINGQVWRLVTYAFCHQDILHILFNMWFLAMFGATLERMYGAREFVLFYFAAAIVSGVAFVALAFVLRDRTAAVGASGAVMAVMALYALHFPREEISIFGLIRLQIRYLVLIYVLFDLWPVLQSLRNGGGVDNVAHAAHLGGLAFGYLYYRSGIRLDRGWNLQGLQQRWKRSRSRPESVRLYEPEEDHHEPNLDAKVDVILQKILAQGEASLTEQERDLLRKASQRYKEHPRSR